MQAQINITKASILIVLAALFWSIMAVFVKLALPYSSDSMVIFFRFGISFLYIMGLLGFKYYKKQERSRGAFIPKTSILSLHILRATTGVVSMLLFYYALAYIPIVDGTLLVMTNAIFVPVIALVLLKQRMPRKNWWFILLGFLGVALVIRPTTGMINYAAILALLGGMGAAFSMVFLRETSRIDGPHACMAYYFPIAFVVSGIATIWFWHTPDLHELLLLLAVGVFGTSYQECLIRAAGHAPARVVSALMYLSVVFSGLFGWFLWGEMPGMISWFGIILVCAGSLLTILHANKS